MDKVLPCMDYRIGQAVHAPRKITWEDLSQSPSASPSPLGLSLSRYSSMPWSAHLGAPDTAFENNGICCDFARGSSSQLKFNTNRISPEKQTRLHTAPLIKIQKLNSMKKDKKLVELKRGHKLTSVQVIQHKEEAREQGNVAVSKSSWKAIEIEVLLSWLTEVASLISLGMVFHVWEQSLEK